jgi:hypothetical protein
MNKKEALSNALRLSRLPSGNWPETQQARRDLIGSIVAFRDSQKLYRTPAGYCVVDQQLAIDHWVGHAKAWEAMQ